MANSFSKFVKVSTHSKKMTSQLITSDSRRGSISEVEVWEEGETECSRCTVSNRLHKHPVDGAHAAFPLLLERSITNLVM